MERREFGAYIICHHWLDTHSSACHVDMIGISVMEFCEVKNFIQIDETSRGQIYRQWEGGTIPIENVQKCLYVG